MKQRGFTLIELMLASLIISLIVASVYGSFRGGLQAWREGNTRVERHQMIQITLEEMARQLRAAYIAPNNSDIGFTGNPVGMDFVYASLPSDRQQPGGNGLWRVSYRLVEEEEDQLGKLVREQRMTPYTAEIPLTSSEEVIDSVFDLSFQYYGRDGWEESWHSNRDLPQTVRIKLVLEDEAGYTDTFSTLVDIPAGGQEF